MPYAILDTSVIFASINVGDPSHARCRALLSRAEYNLIIPVLCIAEVSHLVNRDLGPETEFGFIESLRDEEVENPTLEDWDRIAELIQKYRDFPLGAVDASIVALAERVGVVTVLTLDRRHFAAIRPRHVDAFTLLP